MTVPDARAAPMRSCIMGPTGTGKTELALALAQRFRWRS